MSAALRGTGAPPLTVVPVGREIEPGVHVELVGQGRWMVRCTTEASAPLRVGEVMGGRRKFLACRLNGDVIGVVVLFVQIGALSLETQHSCGFAADASPSAGPAH